MERSNPKSRVKLIVILISSTLTVMAGATISPSLPGMSEAFSDLPNYQILVKMTLSIPALFIAISSPIMGIVIDKWKRKPVFLISIVVYAIAGSSGYFLFSLNEILISRAILGIGVGGIMTTSTTLIADYFTGDKRNKIIGMQGAFMSFGGVLYLLVGGLLADIDWRTPFLIYLVSLFILPLALYSINEPIIFKEKQKKSIHNIIRIKSIYLVYPIAIFSMAMFYLIPIQMPFFLKDIENVTNAQVGLAISSMTLFAAVIALYYKKIKSLLSFNMIFVLLFVLMGIGYIIISISENYTIVILGLAISGLGLGLLLPNMNLYLVSVTSETIRGSIIGGLVSFIFLGQFLSPLVGQPSFEVIGVKNTYAIGGFAMICVSMIFLIHSIKMRIS